MNDTDVIEKSICKVYTCDMEAMKGFPCCSYQHGLLFRDLKEILKEACDADRATRGLLEDYDSRQLTIEQAIYYGQFN